MKYLTDLSQQYSRRADRIVKRHTDKDGAFDAAFQPHVDFYRDAAARVAVLNEGLDETSEAVWSLESEQAAAIAMKKVSARDKAATPQELIAKANG